jgi:hypothetical protein
MLFKYLPGASGLRGLLSRRGWSGWSGSTDIRREASPARIHLDSMRIRPLVPSAMTFNRRKHGLATTVTRALSAGPTRTDCLAEKALRGGRQGSARL